MITYFCYLVEYISESNENYNTTKNALTVKYYNLGHISLRRQTVPILISPFFGQTLSMSSKYI